jgi:tetratricopeptide (TPR) repeat protein
LFLAKVQTVAITDLPGYAERMERFEKLQPSNAWAQYYYAVSLWKDRRNPEQVQSLLHKAVKLDPTMGAAHLQLGIVHFDQNDFTAARADFQKAIEIAPKLEEAHYRLGQVYRRLGETDAARKELAIYEQLSKESAREEESRRSEMGQFVYELRKR